MKLFSTIKTITIEDASIVVTINNKSNQNFAIDQIDKVYIKVQSRTNHLYLSSLALLIVLLFFVLKFSSFTTSLVLATFATLVTLILISYRKHYQLVIRLKSKEEHHFKVATDSKFKIIEKTRMLRAKLQELNFKDYSTTLLNE